MNEGIFHFLINFAEREPLQFISTLVGIPLLILFLGVATFKRIHPVIVWFVLSGVLFGLSQLFPENRDQRLSIGIIEGAFCAALVWWWFSRIAPALRAKRRRNQSS